MHNCKYIKEILKAANITHVGHKIVRNQTDTLAWYDNSGEEVHGNDHQLTCHVPKSTGFAKTLFKKTATDNAYTQYLSELLMGNPTIRNYPALYSSQTVWSQIIGGTNTLTYVCTVSLIFSKQALSPIPFRNFSQHSQHSQLLSTSLDIRNLLNIRNINKPPLEI